MSRNRNYRAVGSDGNIKERIFLTSLKRHKNSDLFERDPFKIQSYNFHYAERPVYPIQNYRPPETSPSTTSSLKTEMFYYNPNFYRRYYDDYNNDKENFNMVNSRSNNPVKFNEYRRRKFLYDFKSIDTTNRTVKTTTGASAVFKHLPSATVSPQRRSSNNIFQPITGTGSNHGGHVTKSPLLRTSCKRDVNYLSTARGSNTSCLAQRQSKSSNCEPLTKNQCRVNGRFTVSHSASQTRLINNNNNNKNNNNSNKIAGRVPQQIARRPSVMSLVGSTLEMTGRVNSSNTALNRKASQHSRANGGGGNCIINVRKSSSCVNGKRNNTYEAFSPNQRRSVLNATIAPTKSSCSGCEININISSLDDNDQSDNVRIQIETDGCLMNTDRTKQNNTRLRSDIAGKPRGSLSSIVNIDKRLSKFSFKNMYGGNSDATNLREHIREDIVRQRELFAERERARERELERERMRELDREYDKQCWSDLERNRERDRQQELAHENLLQIQKREAERQMEIDRKARAIYVPPPVVPMTSHIYHQSSTERIPSMMPYPVPINHLSPRTGCNAYLAKQSQTSPTKVMSTSRLQKTCVPSTPPPPQPTDSQKDPVPHIILYDKRDKSLPSTSLRNDIRAQRMQATTTILSSPRLLKRSVEKRPSQISNNTKLLNRCSSLRLGRSTSTTMIPPTSPAPAPSPPQNFPTRSPCTPPLAPRHYHERRPLNAGHPIQTTLNNVPIRITTSSRGGTCPNDVAFNTVRVRHDSIPSRQCRNRVFDESLSPYNVNINVYTDNMKMMRV